MLLERVWLALLGPKSGLIPIFDHYKAELQELGLNPERGLKCQLAHSLQSSDYKS
jgi:hypothetical protein